MDVRLDIANLVIRTSDCDQSEAILRKLEAILRKLDRIEQILETMRPKRIKITLGTPEKQ